MFDIAAFTEGWPSSSIPDPSTGRPLVPPGLGPEDRKERLKLRRENRADDLIVPAEVPFYRRYVAGTAPPAEIWFIHRISGYVSTTNRFCQPSCLCPDSLRTAAFPLRRFA